MANENEILVKLKAIDELTPVMLAALKAMETNSANMATALDKVSESTKKTQENTDGLNGSVVTFNTTFLALKAAAEVVYAAFERVSAQFQEAINAALEAEKADNLLTGALIATGNYTQKLSKDLDTYATSVEKATGVSDELVKTHLALGMQMGLSTEKSRQMEEAARKLSVLTGGDVSQAFTMLQGAMSGNTRALGKLLPQVKDMTDAQLKQGGANEIVNKMLTAQYEIYEKSFAVALTKAKTALGNVYEETGKIIIQNPLVIKAVDAFTKGMQTLEGHIKSVSEWITENQAEIEAFGEAMFKAAQIVAVGLGIWAVAAAAAVGPTAALAAAVAVLTSPVTLTLAAVAALTLAFYKWPPLFDVVMGAVKTLIGVALAPLNAALVALLSGLSLVVGVFNKEWAQSIQDAASKMIDLNKNLVVGGAEQAKLGVEALATGKAVEQETKAVDDHSAALKKEYENISNNNKALKDRQLIFAGLNMGTAAERKDLEAAAQERDKSLKEFDQWLQNKKKLAVSAAFAEKEAVAKARAGAMADAGGGQGKAAGADLEIIAEKRKQAELAQMRQAGVINRAQYDEAILASQQRRADAQLAKAQASETALAEALGDTPAAFAKKQALKQEAFNREVAQARELAVARGATAEQANALEAQMRARHHADTLAAEQSFAQQRIALATESQFALAEALGETPAGYAQRAAARDAQFALELEAAKSNAIRRGATEEQAKALEVQMLAKYEGEKFEKQKAFNEQSIAEAMAARDRKADALGESEAGFQLKQQNDDLRFQMELQKKIEQAQMAGATDLELASLREQANEEHLAKMTESRAAYHEREAAMHEQAGNNWDASLAKIRASQERHGAIMGALRGVQQTGEYKGTMDMLSNLSSLRNSHSKKAFEVGKKAAIVEATVKTFMAATSAYAAMAAIPIVGPALGAVAAAAAIAAGFVNIQKINAQKFEGGQADAGMDSIPGALAGKSFVLSQGERVVQPTANQDLTQFLQKEKQGEGRGATNYSITLNYSGAGGEGDARKMAEIVMKEIRTASERGQPVISSKGITT